MGGEGEERGGGGQGNQEEANRPAGCDHVLETRGHIQGLVGQGQLATRIEGQEHRLGEGLTEKMQHHPEQGEPGHAVPARGGIGEQGEEAEYQTEQESSGPGDIGDTAELHRVVVENGVAAEDFGENAVAEVVHELGDDDSQGGPQSRCQDEGRADPLYRLGCGGLRNGHFACHRR